MQEEIAIGVQIAPDFAALLSAQRLQTVVGTVLEREARAGELSLVITDDDGIRELNRDFAGQDAATDVLAFAAQEDSGDFVTAPEAGQYLGDVIVSFPRAAAQAKEYGHPVEQELELLIVHGVLHLLGYDHADEQEKVTMWARQDAILASL